MNAKAEALLGLLTQLEANVAERMQAADASLARAKAIETEAEATKQVADAALEVAMARLGALLARVAPNA